MQSVIVVGLTCKEREVWQKMLDFQVEFLVPPSITEISEQLGLSRARAYRIMKRLVQKEFVFKCPRLKSRMYRALPKQN